MSTELIPIGNIDPREAPPFMMATNPISEMNACLGCAYSFVDGCVQVEDEGISCNTEYREDGQDVIFVKVDE